MNATTRPPLYITWNKQSRKYDEADITTLPIGATVIEMLWSVTLKDYITIPGTCIYAVTGDGLELVKDEE